MGRIEGREEVERRRGKGGREKEEAMEETKKGEDGERQMVSRGR